MAQEKEYTGTFTLGSTTASYDLEQEPANFQPFIHLDEDTIREAANAFRGELMQVPPAHSAIQIDGKRVYELARAGKEVIIEPRKVNIKTFEIGKIELPVVDFRVVCGTGTYIRSLAHDYGKALGCGAHLSSLRRTRIGDFSVDEAMTMESFEAEVRRLKDMA
jgi:tRNA pseudouridine55 synthase